MNPSRTSILFMVAIIFCLSAQSDPLTNKSTGAAELLPHIGVNRGVVTVLNASTEVTLTLARESQLLIYARVPDAKRAAELTAQVRKAGYGIGRVVVEQGTIDKLPATSNLLDAIIHTSIDESDLKSLSVKEILRALRPGGTAILGNDSTDRDADFSGLLKSWAAGSKQDLDVRADANGVFVQFTKPEREGTDEWTHWEKSPDNNPVSGDSVIKAPYMTQFMATPFYIGMPSLTTAAGGRTFLAVGHIAHHQREWEGLNRIIARNGYNGTVLWERPLPEGYLVHRSAFIAGKDHFHMIDGESCLLLDAETGKETKRIRIEGLKGEWKWMAMRDGILYVLAGKPDGGVTTTRGDRTFGGWSWADLSKEYYPNRFPGNRLPVGFGDMVAAYDLSTNKPLWIHKEETLIDSRGLALEGQNFYLYCPDRHVRCLEAKTGSVKWTNAEKKVFGMIEQPGRGLTSTPGWRTQTMMVATPEALVIQGQTRMNVVAISSEGGYLLWNKKKITNNPNAIYVDGKIVLAVGAGGAHVVVDPVTGDVEENLKFRKRACSRLTACPDSFFVRGEGMLRFDRESKKVLVDGAQRPACNDGVMPAHGLLYLGPWQCDCNLSLIGNIAKCSAGNFQFDHVADSSRLRTYADDISSVAAFELQKEDWPTYRGNNSRSSSTQSVVKLKAGPPQSPPLWSFVPTSAYTPTAPVAANGLVFSSGNDGVIRAIDATNGTVKWEYATPGDIKYPPTIDDGRVYVGCGDGRVYCLEAETGRALWSFRAAPVERHIMVYDRLSSTWPVGSGVLVEDGVAYCAAGIVDHDGTFVYALNAKTGEIKWQNNSSGHLNEELRKGVSVQGNLATFRGQLLMAGGNQVSPAQYDLKTGRCTSTPAIQGQPRANSGRFVGAFGEKSVIIGGRILYSSPDNVSTKGSFAVFSKGAALQLNQGGVAPAWNDDLMTLVNFKHGDLTCCNAPRVEQQITKGYGEKTTAPRQRRWLSLASVLQRENAFQWRTNMDQPNKFETVSQVVGPKTIVAAVKYQMRFRAQPQWFLVVFDAATGKLRTQRELASTPLPDGLLVDRSGRIVVTMVDGSIRAY